MTLEITTNEEVKESPLLEELCALFETYKKYRATKPFQGVIADRFYRVCREKISAETKEVIRITNRHLAAHDIVDLDLMLIAGQIGKAIPSFDVELLYHHDIDPEKEFYTISISDKE